MELENLLAADSVKLWNLTDRSVNGESVIQDCERDDLLSLKRSLSSTDSAQVVFSSGEVLCPDQTDSISFAGSWLVPDTANLQLLLFIVEGDSNIMSINSITSQFLQLSHYQEGSLIQEDYYHP